MKQTRITKYIIYGKLYFISISLSFRASSLVGRFNGSKIFLNSIPKSGTHLLSRTLMYLPTLRYSVEKTLIVGKQKEQSILDRIAKIRPGEFILGHIKNNKKVFHLMQEKSIRSIMLIRDPRQIVISHYKYVTYIEVTHYSHHFFKNLKDDNERLLAVINGVENKVESIDKILDSYSDWLTNSDTLVVKYEDLIGEKGGGRYSAQIDVLNKISSFLGIKINENEIKKLTESIFSTDSPTFRSGRIDSWRGELSNEHKELLKQKVGAWLIRYGYEKDLNW